MDPVSLDIERQFECESLRTVAADGDVDGGAIGIGPGGGDRLRLRRRGRGQLRLFRLTECSGVPLPAAPMADRVVERRVRVCLLANNNPISNVLTVPAAWSRTEEDQWKFGENLWR